MITEKCIQDITYEQAEKRMQDSFEDAFAWYAALYIIDELESSNDVETDISLESINEIGETLANFFLQSEDYDLGQADIFIRDCLKSIGIVEQRQYDDDKEEDDE